jgi:hypothetical protein
VEEIGELIGVRPKREVLTGQRQSRAVHVIEATCRLVLDIVLVVNPGSRGQNAIEKRGEPEVDPRQIVTAGETGHAYKPQEGETAASMKMKAIHKVPASEVSVRIKAGR